MGDSRIPGMAVAQEVWGSEEVSGLSSWLRRSGRDHGAGTAERWRDGPVQKLIIVVVILGFVAFVYQGIALSSREEARPEGTAPVTVGGRPQR